MLRIWLVAAMALLVSPCWAQTPLGSEAVFRVSYGDNQDLAQTSFRDDGYFGIYVHDTHIYANNRGRRTDIFNLIGARPQARAQAQLFAEINSDPIKRRGATNFANIFKEDRSSGPTWNRTLSVTGYMQGVSTGGLRVLPTTRMPLQSQTTLVIGFYGFVDPQSATGRTNEVLQTIEAVGPVLQFPQIASAVPIIHSLAQIHDTLTNFVYNTSEYGRAFARGITDTPRDRDGILDRPGYWVLSDDFSPEERSGLVVHHDENGYRRLARKTQEGDLGRVVDKTYALIEIRAIQSRVVGRDADYRSISEVSQRFDEATRGIVGTNVTQSQQINHANQLYDWLVANARHELSGNDKQLLRYEVLIESLRVQCRREILRGEVQVCAEDRMEKLQNAAESPTMVERAESAIELATQDLELLSQKERLLRQLDLAQRDGSFIIGTGIQGLTGVTANDILNSRPEQLQDFQRALQNSQILVSPSEIVALESITSMGQDQIR